MVIEIPKDTDAKFEIATKERFNPIRQDVKDGQLRFLLKSSKYNYGAIPQTWEDPDHIDEATGCRGDRDPVDIIDIGSRQHKCGSVIGVKVLGVMAFLDSGQTDWKVISIDVTDPIAREMEDIDDVKRLRPEILTLIGGWLKTYKVPDGQPNKLPFDGEAQDRKFAEKIIQETHMFWKNLVNSTGHHELERTNATVTSSPHRITF